MRRRAKTAAQMKAWAAKMVAAKAAKRAQREQRAARVPASALSPAARKARRKTLQAFGLPAAMPTRAAAHHRARSNGSAAPREPDIEGAVISLTRAENWLAAAKYMGILREYDPAHREIVIAMGHLLGLSAP